MRLGGSDFLSYYEEVGKYEEQVGVLGHTHEWELLTSEWGVSVGACVEVSVST